MLSLDEVVRIVSFRVETEDSGNYECSVAGLTMSKSCTTNLKVGGTFKPKFNILNLHLKALKAITFSAVSPEAATAGLMGLSSGLLGVIVVLVLVFFVVMFVVVRRYRRKLKGMK